MTRLIDADALREQFKDRSLEDFTYLHFIDAIDNAPTVPQPDFKEGYKQAIIDGKTNFSRPHGKWIEGKNGTIMCSKCGCEIRYSYLVGNKPEFPKFCCDCGAEMRGDKK